MFWLILLTLVVLGMFLCLPFAFGLSIYVAGNCCRTAKTAVLTFLAVFGAYVVLLAWLLSIAIPDWIAYFSS